MKIALIGGGGARTPAVVYALARHWGHLPVELVTLYDTDQPRQAMMGAVCSKILEGTDARFRIAVMQEPEAAIAGADFVIVSVRVGGQQARAVDERIALDHGCIGQETTGPAGFAYALRSIPVVQHYAEMAARLAPRSYLINFTNPSGLVTQALSRPSPVPTIGVCDSPHLTIRQVSRATGIPEEDLDWRYSGLNHLGWLTSVRYGNKEILPAVIADDSALRRLAGDDLFPPELIRHLGVVPNEYCYYYYYRIEALQRQQAAAETRGELLARLERQLQADMARVDPADAGAVVDCYGLYLKAREESYLATERQGPRSLPRQTLRELILSGGEGYIGVALKIISGLSGLGNHRAVLNVPNHGRIIPGMDSEDVVETLCEITADGILPLPGPPLGRESLAVLRSVKAYERLTAEAALAGSRRLAVRALTHHPLVCSYPLAEKLVDAYLSRHRDLLPQFARGEP